MTSSEIGDQVVPIVGFRVDALARGIRRIPDELLLGNELVQLSKVAPIEGIDETLDDLADPLGRALAWIVGRSRGGSHLATGQDEEERTARHDQRETFAHR